MYKLLCLVLFLFNIQAFASNEGLYNFKWLDEDEKVYVIQNKEFVKDNTFGFDLSIIDSSSSPYQDTVGLSLGLVYYISDNYSLDFTYKQYSNSDSSDLKNLLSAYDSEVKPIIRKIDSAMLFHFNWIPFYGKINIFDQILFFDWGLGIGFGQFQTQGNYKTFLVKNKTITFEQETDTGFNLKSYFKFYTKSRMTFGVEYNLSGVNTIKSPDETKEYLYFADIIGSVGYIF